NARHRSHERRRGPREAQRRPPAPIPLVAGAQPRGRQPRRARVAAAGAPAVVLCPGRARRSPPPGPEDRRPRRDPGYRPGAVPHGARHREGAGDPGRPRVRDPGRAPQCAARHWPGAAFGGLGAPDRAPDHAQAGASRHPAAGSRASRV
ncbi:MAG: hypothetical protein AVDCRST_MAG76-2338, partial [uncultured Acidimicrobiales bacterium]